MRLGTTGHEMRGMAPRYEKGNGQRSLYTREKKTRQEIGQSTRQPDGRRRENRQRCRDDVFAPCQASPPPPPEPCRGGLAPMRLYRLMYILCRRSATLTA